MHVGAHVLQQAQPLDDAVVEVDELGLVQSVNVNRHGGRTLAALDEVNILRWPAPRHQGRLPRSGKRDDIQLTKALNR